MNLLNETKDKLKEHGFTLDDILLIYGNDFQITKENFIEVANTEYDDGYGSPEVATDLKILGNEFIMFRNEYDGSEWWEFKYIDINTIPKDIKTVSALTCKQKGKSVGWNNLQELNE